MYSLAILSIVFTLCREIEIYRGKPTQAGRNLGPCPTVRLHLMLWGSGIVAKAGVKMGFFLFLTMLGLNTKRV
jgi:hypothetical protein